MKPFQFHCPTHVVFGTGVLSTLPRHTKARKVRNALVVTDPGLVSAGIVAKVTDLLSQAEVASYIFDGISPNPKDVEVENGALVFRDSNADALIAVGGGSAIDAAKAIGVLAKYGGSAVDYEGVDKIPGAIPTFFAIPTTAGTGSEVTYWSVISLTMPEKRKIGIGSVLLAPRVALVDPELTLSLPSRHTAHTGMDALTHALEAYVCTASNAVSDALALSSLDLIGTFLVRAHRDGADLEAREGMMAASLLGGMAFSNSDLGIVHSMSEAVGGVFDIAHGFANACCLVPAVEFNYPAAWEKYEKAAKTLTGGKRKDIVDVLLELEISLEIPRQMTVPKVDAATFGRLIDLAMANSATAYNPRTVTAEDFRRLFGLVLEEER